MYPQVTKEVPSAPPSYADSVNAAPQYSGGAPQYPGAAPQYPGAAPPYEPKYPSSNIHQQQAPPPQVIVVQHGIPPLGPQSVQLICPTCKAGIQSRVDEESSTSAYLCCMLMFIVGCALCSCIPFCMDNFKTYKHSCPRCNAFVGTYVPQ